MRAADVLRRGTDYLARHGVDAPRANAEALLEHVLGVDRTSLLTATRAPDADEARAYGRALCRRASGTPLQHLTGEHAFRHLVVAVRPGVFVPRPETEILVDVALAAIRDVASPRVADVCTGSGVVALSIAQERPDATVVASDLSLDAVALARENAAALGLTVDVRPGDLLEAIDGPLDLVTCNPPYVPSDRRDALPPEVLADPSLAVFGGPDIVERLYAEAATRLASGGAVVVEIEASTGATIGALAEAAGYVDVAVHPDLAGRPRIVSARRP
jgi:release factor glutamine methyltransferase